MAGHRFALVTTWHLHAPVERVWRVLADAEAWPLWWPFVETVENVEPGEADGLNSVWRHTWKTMLPYRLSFQLRVTRIEAPALLEAEVGGDLAGTGVCRLFPAEGGTRVRYEWNVCARRPWMRWLVPIARPVFLWNHRRVMEGGEAALRVRLAGHGGAEDA